MVLGQQREHPGQGARHRDVVAERLVTSPAPALEVGRLAEVVKGDGDRRSALLRTPTRRLSGSVCAQALGAGISLMSNS